MPIQRIGFSLVVCLLLAGATSAQTVTTALKQPVGMVLRAQGASLIRTGQGLRSAVKGALLFDGDTVATSESGSAEVAWCATTNPVKYVLAADASLRLDNPPAGGGQGEPLPFCELPVLPPPEASFRRPAESMAIVGAAPTLSAEVTAALDPERQRKLRLIDEALADDPADLLALVSRASLLAAAGKDREASAEFARLDGALSDVGQGWAKEMRVETSAKGAPIASTPGDTFAVVVGVSEYADPKLKLHFARRDAEHMRDFLLSPRGGGLKRTNIEVLLDREADRAHLQSALEKALRRQAARVIVFLSAHGVLVNGRPYLVTWDCPLANGPEKCYPMSELIGLIRLNQPRIGRIDLYVDACRLAHPDPISEPNRVNAKVATTLDAIPGRRVVLFASAELAYEHQVFDDGKGHGAFTYHLLKGLNDPPESYRSGDHLTLGELIRFIMDGVPVTTRKHQYPAERVSDLSKPDEIVARFDPNVPGVTIGGTTVMPEGAFKEPKGEADFSRLGRDAAMSRGEWLEAETRSLEILQRYLDGDEVPQEKSDFLRGAEYTAEALRVSPDSAELASRLEFFRARAQLFDVTGAVSDASKLSSIRAQLEKAIRLDPDNAVAYNALGIIYLQQAEYDKAKECFDDAIHRSPYWAYPRHNRALALSESGDYAGAEREYLFAIRQASAFSYLPYNLGLLYQRTNRKRDAERAYRCADYLVRQRVNGGRVDAKPRKQAGCPDGDSLHAPRSVRLGAGERDNPVRAVAPELALGVLKNDAQKVRSVVTKLRSATVQPEVTRYLTTAQHDLAVVVSRRKKGWDEAEAIWAELSRQDYAPSRLALADHLVLRARHARGAARESLLSRAEEQYRTLIGQQPNNAEMAERMRQLLLEKANKR